MTIPELLALGFTPNRLPPFYGFCRTCDRYRWFDWYIGGLRLDVSACSACQTVPAREVIAVEREVARQQCAAIVEALDEAEREVLEAKGML